MPQSECEALRLVLDAGIVVSDQIPLREFLRRCCVLLNRYTPAALADQLLWLPKG